MTDDNVVDLGAERARRRPDKTPEYLEDLHMRGMQPGGLFGGGESGSWRTEKLSDAQFSSHKPRTPSSNPPESRFLQGLGLAAVTASAGLQLAARHLPPTHPIPMVIAPMMGAGGMGVLTTDQINRPSSLLNKALGRNPKKD